MLNKKDNMFWEHGRFGYFCNSFDIVTPQKSHKYLVMDVVPNSD